MKAKQNKLEKKKIIQFIYLVIIILLLSFTFIFGRNSYLKLMKGKIEVSQLQKRVDLLKAENEKLRKENEEIKTNPEMIERIARENLGYKKDGEKVFRFMPPAENDTKSEQKKGK